MEENSHGMRRAYGEELARETVLLGRRFAVLANVFLVYFIFQDTVLLKFQGVLPWRLLAVAACTGFLVLSHTWLTHATRWATPLYTLTLTLMMTSTCGFAWTVLRSTPATPGHRYGVMDALMVTILGAFVFASGA